MIDCAYVVSCRRRRESFQPRRLISERARSSYRTALNTAVRINRLNRHAWDSISYAWLGRS